MGENVEQGRNADILQSIIDSTEYTDPPQSRIEDLLLQVKEVIEEGGGGGGDVTSVNGKTGAVTLTASDVGAYTTEETGTLLGNKQDKTLTSSVTIGTETKSTVEGAIGEVAAIIPAKAATSNKLSTAADTAKEDITATASGSDITLTDAADARVQGVTIKGHSEVVEGAIKSIGDAGWGVVDLGTLTWTYNSNTQSFLSSIADGKHTGAMQGVPAYCSIYNVVIDISTAEMKNLDIKVGNYTAGIDFCSVLVKNFVYTDATAFTSAMSGVLLYYPLADATSATPILGITSKDGAGQGTAVTIVSRDYHFDEHLYESTLPLCSLSDTYYDEMNSADEIIIKRCAAISDVSDFNWRGSNGNFYFVLDSGCSEKVPIMIEGYTYQDVDSTDLGNMCCTLEVYNADSNITRMVCIHNTSCYTVAALTTALANKKAILPWDKAIVIPMTATEKSAFVALRTYDDTTRIDATDAPSMTVDYLLNTDNGQAVARIDERAMKQNATLLAMIAAPYDDTATYAVGNYCTYGDRLWKCNTAIGTAEPFTAAHWTATTVMEEIS